MFTRNLLTPQDKNSSSDYLYSDHKENIYDSTIEDISKKGHNFYGHDSHSILGKR